jgi:L-ascorbate metabolism protein UlaG (beta-lactamase superfamily)
LRRWLRISHALPPDSDGEFVHGREQHFAMKLAIRAAQLLAVVLLIVAIVAIAVFARLWQDRPPLGLIGWPQAAVVSQPTDMVTVTWLGTTTLLFDDRETQILIDGNFTRVGLLKIVSFLPISSDVATINYALTEFGISDRLAAIVPVHSHFDHAMDIGHVANRTRAVILGSESTANIARGADVPVDQYQILAEGETRQFGDFTIRLLASRHAPVKSGGDGPWFPGTIDTELRQPASVNAWKEGVVWSVFIGHPRGTTLIQGSGGFIEGKLQGESADVVMLGIAGLAGLENDYVAKLWNETVGATRAKKVLAVHFDDFTAPFGVVRLFPHIADNILVTAGRINDVIAASDAEITIQLPPFGQQIPLY